MIFICRWKKTGNFSTYIVTLPRLNILKRANQSQRNRQLSVVNWAQKFFCFSFFYNVAYRGEYVVTTPGLFTVYAIADEGRHYRSPIACGQSLDGFFKKASCMYFADTIT